MPTLGLNHVNIRTADIAVTTRFYTEILGFRYAGPEHVNGFPRNWLLDEHGSPIIHLRELAPDGPTFGALDHIALNCAGMATILGRLKEAGVRFATVNTLVDGVTQVFLKDPNGVPLELNFSTASETV